MQIFRFKKEIKGIIGYHNNNIIVFYLNTTLFLKVENGYTFYLTKVDMLSTHKIAYITLNLITGNITILLHLIYSYS